MVVVAVAGAHTREIWSRLPLEIAVAIEDRCRGWGPLGSTIRGLKNVECISSENGFSEVPDNPSHFPVLQGFPSNSRTFVRGQKFPR